MDDICPRSANNRPDDFPARECMAAGECGCKTPQEHFIAGMREAAEIVQAHIDAARRFGPGDTGIGELSRNDIRARIASLEKDHS